MKRTLLILTLALLLLSSCLSINPTESRIEKKDNMDNSVNSIEKVDNPYNRINHTKSSGIYRFSYMQKK